MDKKLYCVKVTLYVMAENESEACLAATGAKFDIFECTARKAEHLDPDWYDAIPYNSDDARTCAEIFISQERADHPANPYPTSISPRQPVTHYASNSAHTRGT